jgi:hypothetical protein
MGTLMWAGFAASVLAACTFWLLRTTGLTRFSPTTLLGCMVHRDPRLPLTETTGVVLFMLVGTTLVPMLYAVAMRAAGGLGWGTGVVVGLVHGALTAGLLPWVAGSSACVRDGHLPRPGRLALGWGRGTPAAVVAGHVVYGAIVGAVAGAA